MEQLSIITLSTKEPIEDFAKARNRELDKTKTEWVMFVDKDEEMSPELKKELDCHAPSALAMTNITGYKIRRIDRFLGKWLRFGETGNVKIVRLARKDSGRWERAVHEVWKIKGKAGELKSPIYHYHDSVGEMIGKIDRYSSIEAEWRSTVIPRLDRGIYKNIIDIDLGSKAGMTMLLLYPMGKFIWNYFVKLGFLDGMEGFILAGLMSFHSFLVRSKQLETLMYRSFAAAHQSKKY